MKEITKQLYQDLVKSFSNPLELMYHLYVQTYNKPIDPANFELQFAMWLRPLNFKPMAGALKIKDYFDKKFAG